jgi:hypothetical protein
MTKLLAHDALTTEDDCAVLRAAQRDGQVSAHLFERGDFSESGFLLYGRLEDLTARGLLRFESWSGDPNKGAEEVLATFKPVLNQAA